jgi:hypothetical protein
MAGPNIPYRAFYPQKQTLYGTCMLTSYRFPARQRIRAAATGSTGSLLQPSEPRDGNVTFLIVCLFRTCRRHKCAFRGWGVTGSVRTQTSLTCFQEAWARSLATTEAMKKQSSMPKGCSRQLTLPRCMHAAKLRRGSHLLLACSEARLAR